MQDVSDTIWKGVEQQNKNKKKSPSPLYPHFLVFSGDFLWVSNHHNPFIHDKFAARDR